MLPEAQAFAFPPPAIPGVGTSGGATFMLEDRSGQDVEFLAKNTNAFIAAARKRPEFASVIDDLHPQRAADVRQGRPRQGAQAGRRAERRLQDAADLHGRRVRQLLQPLRASSGRCTCRPRASARTQRRQRRPVLRAEQQGRAGAAVGAWSTCRRPTAPSSPCTTTATAPRRSTPRPSPATAPARSWRRCRRCSPQTQPREMGYDYMGMSFQEQVAGAGRAAERHLRLLAADGVPHPGGAVRELVAAVQRAARRADRRLRRLRWRCGCAPSTTTSTRRSAWSC